jgi:hypothetical protein
MRGRMVGMKYIGWCLTILGAIALADTVFMTINYYAVMSDESQRRAPIAIVGTAFVTAIGLAILYKSSRRK